MRRITGVMLGDTKFPAPDEVCVVRMAVGVSGPDIGVD